MPFSFKCRKFDLQNELQVVASVVDRKNRDDIMSCVYLSVLNPSNLMIAGSSYSLMMTTTLKIDGGGTLLDSLDTVTRSKDTDSMAVDADKFLALIKKLPDKIIEITHDKNLNRAVVRCDSSRYTLGCQESSLYPLIKIVENFTYRLPLRFLLRAFQGTVGLIEGKESAQTHHSGVLVVLDDGVLELVATDGVRMASFFTTLETDKKFITILPKKTLQELITTMEGSTQSVIELEVTDNHAFFRFGKYVYRSSVLAGSFPNYKVIMDSVRGNNATQYRINRKKLQESVDRCVLFAGKNQGFGVNIDFKDKEVTISTANDLGDSAFEVVEADSSIPYATRVNGSSLSSYLESISSDDVVDIYVNTKQHTGPILLRSQSDRNYFYIIQAMERI